MSTTIESLELEIKSNSQSAVSGIEALALSLDKLKNATKGGLGLASISRQIKDMAVASNSINSGAISNVEGLAKAIQLLGGTKISNTIAAQITAISKSLQGADFSTGKAKMEGLVDALSPLASLSKTNLSSYITNLKKLPETFTELSKIDMSSFAAKIQEVATAMKPLADEMQKVANGFAAFPNKIQKLLNATNQIPASNTNASKSFTDLYYKLKTAANGFKALGKAIYSAIQKSSDYVENVNLFTVSMGEYASEAKEYAETVGEVMGIDPGEWMRNQGVFMTLATGFGVAGDRAAVMSKNLTQLGYDLSSFFNISYEDAMEKLQSGLAGELEPLRRIGYDLSQAKLEATALELGIDKAVSSMTQAEKAELRYYAIMTQVTTAHGDMARTLEAPANQLKVFKAQLDMAAREIGNIFIPALNAILPYAIAIVKVIRILASNIASLFGYELPEVDYSGVSSMGNVAEDTSSALDDATDSAKKLKSYMLGFDELNVINPNEDSSSGIDDALSGFDFELPDYSKTFLAGLADSRVSEIVEDMKEWLGLTEDIDSWSELLDTRLGHILKTVGLIGLGIAAWKVTKTFMDSITALKLLLSNPSYAIAISVILTITGFVMAFDGMESAIENGLDEFNFAEIVGGGLLGTGGAALLGSKIAAWISTAFGSSTVATALSTATTNLSLGTASAAGAALGAGVSGIILGIPTYFVGIYDACTEGIDWLNSLLVGVGATAAGAGIGTIIGAAGGPIGAGIGALIGLVVGLITDFTIWLWQNFDDVEEWFNDLPVWAQGAIIGIANVATLGIVPLIAEIITLIQKWDELVVAIKNLPSTISKFFKSIPNKISKAFSSISEWVTNLPETVKTKFEEIGTELDALPAKIETWFSDTTEKIKQWFADLWQPIKDYDWYGLGQDIGQWFGDAVKTAYTFVSETVPQWFGEVATSIKEGFETFFNETLPTFFNETIPQVVDEVAKFFETLPDKIKAVVVSVWAGFVDVGTEIINGIVEGWSTAKQAVIDFVDGFVQGFRDALGIHSPSTVFAEIGGYLVDGLFQGITDAWLSITTFFTDAIEEIETLWQSVPAWFDTNVTQPTSSFFEGLWTSVSGFFLNLRTDVKRIWKLASNWFNETVIIPIVGFFEGLWTSVSGFFSSLWEGIKAVWVSVSTWFNETIIDPVKTAFSQACDAIGGFFSSLWLSIRQGVASAMNGVIGSIESVVNRIVGGINSLIGGFNDVVQWAAKVIGADWGGVTILKEVTLARITVPQYGDGGFPDQGQMFIARERGAEMVGNIGRRTAVANNDQIVSGIAGGVAEANEEQNALLREQNSLLRAILEKDSGVYLDGKNLTNSVEKYQRERGRVLITGGVV